MLKNLKQNQNKKVTNEMNEIQNLECDLAQQSWKEDINKG